MSSNLSYALTKIQFGQITKSTFEKNADSLIEALGDDYPIFHNRQINRIELQFNAATNEQKSVTTQLPIISLMSADKKWGVRITQDDVILHTNAYSTYEDFSKKLSTILKNVKAIMNIRHVGLVGLRYLNKLNEENFAANFQRTEFLQPEINGMQMAGSNNASRYIDGKYAININSGVTINNTKYPPDLAELVMDLKVENEILTGAWAHLDIDVYTNNQELKPYEHDSVF
jgi:uncharacterized protein (TIGR04255 family)